MVDPFSDFVNLLSESIYPMQMMRRSVRLRYQAFRHMKCGGIIKREQWIWAEGYRALCFRAGDFYFRRYDRDKTGLAPWST